MSVTPPKTICDCLDRSLPRAPLKYTSISSIPLASALTASTNGLMAAQKRTVRSDEKNESLSRMGSQHATRGHRNENRTAQRSTHFHIGSQAPASGWIQPLLPTHRVGAQQPSATHSWR